MLVYLATNKRTGLKYVGATSGLLSRRQREHRGRAGCNGKKNHTRFELAIRECGWDAFEWNILSECKTLEELVTEERRWVAELKTRDPEHGYNMTKGGCGVIGYEFSEEARAKISRAGMGRRKSEETRRKLSIANKGKRPSDACIAASLVRGLTTEQRRANGRSNRGRKHVWSDERKAAFTETMKAHYSNYPTIVPNADLPVILERRAAGESLALIAAGYNTTAPTLFYWLKRRASS